MKRQTLEKLQALVEGLREMGLLDGETGEEEIRIVLRRDARVDLGDLPGLQLELDAALRAVDNPGDKPATVWPSADVGYGSRLYTVSECMDPETPVYEHHPLPWRAQPMEAPWGWRVEDARGTRVIHTGLRDVAEWIAALPELLQELGKLAGRDDE